MHHTRVDGGTGGVGSVPLSQLRRSITSSANDMDKLKEDSIRLRERELAREVTATFVGVSNSK
jgi:hypothetical protein